MRALPIDRHRRAGEPHLHLAGAQRPRAVNVHTRVHTGVTIADDTIYDDGGAASGLLALTALGTSVSDGYTATLTVGVSTT